MMQINSRNRQGGTTRPLLLGVLAFGLMAASAGVIPAEEGLTVKPLEKWSGVFADRQIDFHYVVNVENGFKGRLGWALSINRRTVSRGERAVEATPQEPARVTVPLRIPHVKEGVILEARLVASVFSDDAVGKEVKHEKRLWIFHADPFADRSVWLENLKITLFDPEGKTAQVFEQANIPFHSARSVASLEELSEGLVIIGEGTSLEVQRDLPEMMLKVAASGLPVLCLASSEGAIVMPGADGSQQPRPSGVLLRRRDMITELDNRLDAAAWPQGNVAVSGLTLKADVDRVLAEVSQDDRAWPWVEIVCDVSTIGARVATPASDSRSAFASSKVTNSGLMPSPVPSAITRFEPTPSIRPTT
jgi:hypothetical protein